MKNTIDWTEYERTDHVLAWIVLELIAKHGVEKMGVIDSHNLKIELKINEIPVDFVRAMNYLNDQLELLRSEARKEGEQQARRELMERLETFLDQPEEQDT